MKNALFFVGGFVVGGAAGVGATYFFMKKRTEDYINEELEKIEKDEGITAHNDDLPDKVEEEEESQNEEEPISDLAEMAKKVKSEEADKTDYSAFSKSEEKGDEKQMPKKAIEYIDEEKAYDLEAHENYDIEDMTAFVDGTLAFDSDDSKIDPEKIGIDKDTLLKMGTTADNPDDLFVVDHTERKVYAIVKIDETYEDMVDKDEYDEEIEEDEQPEA